MTVSTATAKDQLCQLLERVEKGERITICRHGRPVADLVASNEPDPRPPKKAVAQNELDDWLPENWATGGLKWP